MPAYDSMLSRVAAEVKKNAPKLDGTEQARAWIECNAFMDANKGFYPCEDNKELLLKWLSARDLPITVENLERGFKELAENAQLYFSEPPPRGFVPVRRPPYKWTSSSFNREAVDEFKFNWSQWSEAELRQCMSINKWTEWPGWLLY